jgi:CubicO group peptidase (beta-lactamase class C family)
MKKMAIVLAVCLIGQVVSAQVPAESSEPATGGALVDPVELEIFLDGAVEALLEAHDVAGGTVSVVKDGEIFFAKGYGLADAEEGIVVDAATSMFRIASISKLFAWTAVMQLWEQGRVDLDRDVNTYLDFEVPATFVEPITLTHLLTHTAGFEDRARGLFAVGEEDMAPLGQVLAQNIPGRVWPPGEVSAYSNYGAALAGYVVERVSGLPFEEYVEQHIYGPLGMDHSTFRQPVPSVFETDLAAGHSFYDGIHHVQDFEWDPGVADGAMSTSAVDMANFMIAHLQLGRFGDGRILDETTARKMHSRLFVSDPRIPAMAHGFYEVDANGRRAIAHGGDLAYHHSDLVLLPEDGVGIFVSFNSDTGGDARNQIVSVFLDRYYPELEKAPVDESPDFAARADRFTGWYRMCRSSYETIEKVAVFAFGDLTVDATSDNSLRVSAWGENAVIVEVEPLLFRPVGEKFLGSVSTIAFEENEDGEITHLHPMPAFSFEKIKWYETVRFHLAVLVVCVLAFVIRIIRAWTGRKRASERTAIERWIHRLATGLSVLNLVFLGWLGVMLVEVMETYLFPDSIYAALTLPMMSVVLTFGLAVLVVMCWIKRDGSFMQRVFSSIFCFVAVAFIWTLNYWNLVGWKY